jgi:hypothetical protein
MKIFIQNNKRILLKDINKEVGENINEEIDVSNGQIIEYTGIYYKEINDIVDIVEIETTFIGIIQEHKANHNDGIIGIYVKPLYIWSKINGEWYKIVNMKLPDKKYFLYPHLLILPHHYYNYHPLYYLHTCYNTTLDEFKDITKTFELTM